ncbi:unnamed protein product [Clonostachys solani]|uniref:N-acetyltransferase domain-containing protein n=1 Tax=Clonostachys solani TaxID=160281 RepID=A0A9P0ELP3_9HYPO|nr:unnamed protein product [Clonostachys solani]
MPSRLQEPIYLPYRDKAEAEAVFVAVTHAENSAYFKALDATKPDFFLFLILPNYFETIASDCQQVFNNILLKMADIELSQDDIERHVYVWAAIREYVVERQQSGNIACLRTDRPAGTYEYVGFEPTKQQFDAAIDAVLKSKDHFLTVIGKDMTQYREMASKHGLDILAQEALMTVDLSGLAADSATTASFVKEFEAKDMGIATRCRLTVTTTEEQGNKPAASGQVGIQRDMAVFDKIKTEEDMRRKGLGSLIMRSLGAEAHARGARTGWLIATLEGQFLYTHLGWKHSYWVLVLGDKNVIENP